MKREDEGISIDLSVFISVALWLKPGRENDEHDI
jgi:hypothetical protein